MLANRKIVITEGLKVKKEAVIKRGVMGLIIAYTEVGCVKGEGYRLREEWRK